MTGPDRDSGTQRESLATRQLKGLLCGDVTSHPRALPRGAAACPALRESSGGFLSRKLGGTAELSSHVIGAKAIFFEKDGF